MRLTYWLTLLCVPFISMAQSQTDSLQNLLTQAKKNNNQPGITYFSSKIAWEHLSIREYDSALHYYYQAYDSTSTDLELTASILDCMGVAYNFKGYPDSSIHYYNHALALYTQIKDTTHAVVIENNLSILFKNIGLYDKALESAFSALEKLEKQKPDRALASCYNTIGAVYTRIGDPANALLYYQKALGIRKQIGYEKGVGQSYNNIGEVYITLQFYDSALANLFRSLEIKRRLNDTGAMGTTLNFIGETYLEQKNSKAAEPYLLEALRIKQDLGERLEQATVLNNLGKLKLLMHDLVQAQRYILEAEKLIRQSGGLDELRKNLELKVLLYKEKHDYVHALALAEELMVIKDSLLNKEKAESLLAMQTQYETEKKEQQINILEQDKIIHLAEIDNKKIWIQSLIVIITLTFVIGALLFYGYRQSQRNKNKVETLLKELHHRVKNNLQILSSILSLQSQNLTDQNAIEVIKSNESRVNTMALIHKKLYGDGDNRAINMKGYIQELVQYLVHTYGFEQRNLKLTLRCEEVSLDVDKAIPLGLVVNELVSNALKYAFVDHEEPALDISLTATQPLGLTLCISDNGPGITAITDFETPQSFGLKMVRTLIRELNARMNVESRNGTIFTIQIPTT